MIHPVRIKELQLYGFKSFPHKTAVRFSTGINAIIGPNGCGKSNILDALRWVLGEQSFSLLRCTKNEDVIFGGTAKLPALGYAEVRLILDNDENLPGFGSEIEVRRRYFRSGESEFYLNRNPCRLKDILDIFFNTGTGTKAYSIFDLRSLRAIIAGELKPMFEEAATLAKYRERKTDCLRKLELTDNDLLRLNDIITERERVTRSLKRQAYRLSAHDRLRGDESRLRLMLLKKQYDAAVAQEKTARDELAASEQKDARVLATIQSTEAEIETVRQELNATRRQREELITGIDELRLQLSRNENQRALAAGDIKRGAEESEQLAQEARQLSEGLTTKTAANEDRQESLQELVSRQAALETELEAARAGTRAQEARLLELRQTLSGLKDTARQALARRADLQRAALALEANVANAEDYRRKLAADLENMEQRQALLKSEAEARAQDLSQASARLEHERSETNTRRQRQAAARARLDVLAQEAQGLNAELLAASEEWAKIQPLLGKPQREAAAAGLGASLLGALTDFVTVHEGYELPVEAALSGLIDSFVVDDEARNALGGLDRTARWLFLLGVEAGEASAVPGSLLEHVTLKPGTPMLIRNRLAGMVLVDRWEDAWNRRQDAAALGHVTPDGIAVQRDGTLVLASTKEGRLALARRDRELAARVDAAKARLAASDDETTRLKEEVRELAAAIETAEGEIVNLVNARSRADAQQLSLNRMSGELSGDLHRQHTEISNLAARRAELAAQQETTGVQLAAEDTGTRETETRIAALETERAGLEQAARDGLQAASEALLRLTQVREQVAGRRREMDLYREDMERDNRRRTEIDQRRELLARDAVVRQQAIEELTAASAQAQSRLDEQNTQLTSLDVAALATREEGLMQALHNARMAQETARQATLDRKLHGMETQHHRTEIEQEALRTHNTNIAEFTAPEEPDVEHRLELLSARLERLGRVNPLAGDEYTKEQAELERLTTQRADVLAAKENLLRTIVEIDRFAREQFVATFETVRTSFREIFERLFVEGEADLILETPGNPLESDITIIAKPKGKSPKRLDQLSDGEKALLALSLLFAFYRVKPAPFCFMDEVDAPLDDANVDRFALFLRELAQKTQIIIITHNRATVEQAGVLFGVTTEEPGVSKLVSVKLSDFGEKIGDWRKSPAEEKTSED